MTKKINENVKIAIFGVWFLYMGLRLIKTPPKVTRVISFSLYVSISLKIDQLVDIIMNLGYKSISGNPGKTRPLISDIPGND